MSFGTNWVVIEAYWDFAALSGSSWSDDQITWFSYFAWMMIYISTTLFWGQCLASRSVLGLRCALWIFMDLDDHAWCAYFTGLMIYISMRIDVDHAASRFALAFDFIAASSQCSLATLHRTGVFRHIICWGHTWSTSGHTVVTVDHRC